ncbi:ABC-3 protein [Pseudarthrobacter chlorophenolicus A6]|uniref:ABC-3 protein n=1 Tax=Pseudarthrobacter chlorophenolicus (strain ATCC 700700 / DSM 12829 / CIP 107037 / JCM 12360 / KCTC 9906 / NCIMB 13794 / A6) TaxID=452863 RepID=B8HDV5_PSECP|nr:zinc ABC transporter permease AztB [Pseudarthrobacter chlorophenolicus]ACL40823.1 ABC-3 protein [Pseudarthrobacter chlorophenolicus A6]SDQ74460.1 zinc/manganese transport system permease protein [Pseudarthrobacter chlorophenolicus]
MEWILEPLGASFVQRAVLAGSLVAVVCAVVGTWVVVRGMAFLGDAMSHGLLPGIAIASLLGGNLLLGAALSAAATAAGVSAISRNRRVSQDTAIGLLFVAMLSLGVIIVSASGSFAVDLTGTLFGDVLAVGMEDVALLAVVGCLVLAVAALFHRALAAATFHPQKAASLGLRPRLAHAVLLGMVTVAVAASFQVVGTLLVFGLLIAPPAAALVWARSIRAVMALGALIGVASVVAGLWISWYASTAAGATIALVAALSYFASALCHSAARSTRPRPGAVAAAVVVPSHASPPEKETRAPHHYA